MTDRLEMEAIIGLISLGYQNTEDKTLDFGVKITEDYKKSYIISMEVPTCYHGKDYFSFISDLQHLDHPAFPIGIYVEEPLNYNNGKKDNIELINTENELINLRVNDNNEEKEDSIFQTKFNNNLVWLKSNSYSSKATLDSIQMDLIHTPIFVTNPNPNFILGKNMKVMLICPLAYVEKCKLSLRNRKKSKKLATKKYTRTLESIKSMKSMSSMKNEDNEVDNRIMSMMRSLYKKLGKDVEEE